MELTTLCYIEKENSYLMLHRVKKKKDLNKEKWIGVGGHIEFGESPEDCIVREVKEETGLELTSYRLRGIITFVTDQKQSEYIFLYTADGFEGEIKTCEEGILKWIEKDKIPSLNLWEGDRVFLDLLQKEIPVFSLKLEYKEEHLVSAVLDGKKQLL